MKIQELIEQLSYKQEEFKDAEVCFYDSVTNRNFTPVISYLSSSDGKKMIYFDAKIENPTEEELLMGINSIRRSSGILEIKYKVTVEREN